VEADHTAPVYGTGEIEVAADPETVWGVLADIGSWPTWNPDITEATLQGPLRPGTTFSWKSGPGTITSELQVVDQPTELTWTGKTMGIPAIHVYRLRPSAQHPRAYDRLHRGVLERAPVTAAAPAVHHHPEDGHRHGPGPAEGRGRTASHPMSPAETPPPAAGRAGPGRPSTLGSVNLVVRFLCELALLVALAVWGFHTGTGPGAKVALGLGAPLLAAVIWGLWVAPAWRRRLTDPTRLMVEAVLFAAGVAALTAAGYPLVAAGFAIVVAVNITLDRVLG
jgi:Protein of unknown function (DUF2568)/Polyketide cyclase / dehydrase and lipid transport